MWPTFFMPNLAGAKLVNSYCANALINTSTQTAPYTHVMSLPSGLSPGDVVILLINHQTIATAWSSDSVRESAVSMTWLREHGWRPIRRLDCPHTTSVGSNAIPFGVYFKIYESGDLDPRYDILALGIAPGRVGHCMSAIRGLDSTYLDQVLEAIYYNVHGQQYYGNPATGSNEALNAEHAARPRYNDSVFFNIFGYTKSGASLSTDFDGIEPYNVDGSPPVVFDKGFPLGGVSDNTVDYPFIAFQHDADELINLCPYSDVSGIYNNWTSEGGYATVDLFTPTGQVDQTVRITTTVQAPAQYQRILSPAFDLKPNSKYTLSFKSYFISTSAMYFGIVDGAGGDAAFAADSTGTTQPGAIYAYTGGSWLNRAYAFNNMFSGSQQYRGATIHFTTGASNYTGIKVMIGAGGDLATTLKEGSSARVMAVDMVMVCEGHVEASSLTDIDSTSNSGVVSVPARGIKPALIDHDSNVISTDLQSFGFELITKGAAKKHTYHDWLPLYRSPWIRWGDAARRQLDAGHKINWQQALEGEMLYPKPIYDGNFWPGAPHKYYFEINVSVMGTNNFYIRCVASHMFTETSGTGSAHAARAEVLFEWNNSQLWVCGTAFTLSTEGFPTRAAGRYGVAIDFDNMTLTFYQGSSTPVKTYAMNYPTREVPFIIECLPQASATSENTVDMYTDGTGYLYTPSSAHAFLDWTSRVNYTEPQNALLLMHCEGSDEGTTFTDSSLYNRTVSTSGTHVTDTAQAKYGSTSIRCDSSSVLSTPASQEMALNHYPSWTVEMFVYVSAAGVATIFNPQYNFTTIYPMQLDYSSGFVRLLVPDHTGATKVSITDPDALPTGQWVHVAATKERGTYRLFIAGVKKGEATPQPFNPGSNTGNSRFGVFSVQAWIDEIRVLRNVAAYTANFTPPSGPHTDPT